MQLQTLPKAVIKGDQFVSENTQTMAATVRECCCVNCWYMADNESQRMRKEYAPGGIALKSTVGRLKKPLPIPKVSSSLESANTLTLTTACRLATVGI